MSVFGCASGPGETRPGNLIVAVAAPTRDLPLTLGEARALLALAEAGRTALTFDSQLLRGPGQRDAGRRALARLRALARP